MQVLMRTPKYVYYNETSPTTMKTAFTLPKRGHVDVCLYTPSKQVNDVSLRILSGAMARDFSQIAKKSHLDPVVQQLKHVEDLITNYRKNQIHLVGNMKNLTQYVNETGYRVMVFAGLTIVLAFVCHGFTVFYLRSFFRAKKNNLRDHRGTPVCRSLPVCWHMCVNRYLCVC
eukprot:Blabericola_migrator_1__8884@NODE_46_length_16830_cov_132_783392_g42_i0_p13_GENE_NODE_46_length_16830_cov_132_783392_g42_i0NODE_46_length_16830_cov_132_783392_g42_i0_p13_ORF_typecomplete_len172_score16_23EMP24_GP25L/PF01105_24/2_4e18_NODE_46_length_16830_cov_132_783392_g42_i037544269